MNRNTVWIKFQEIFAHSCHRRHMFTITSSVSRAMQCKACKCSNAMARNQSNTGISFMHLHASLFEQMETQIQITWMHDKRAVTYIRLRQCTCCNHHDHHRHHKQKHESKCAKHARACGLKRGCGIHDPQHGVRAIQESRRSYTHINTRTCALTLQSFVTHHIIHPWIRNWTLDIRIAQKPRKSAPKSNQQRRNDM